MTVDASPRGPNPRSTGEALSILSGTSQNVLGVAIAAAAMFTVQVLMTRSLGSSGFGVVTLLTQAAFICSFATRSGMDMGVLRDVSIDVGVARKATIRKAVARAVEIATATSALVAITVILFSRAIREWLGIPPSQQWAVVAAAAGLPFIAVANVWLAATRGLKIMRYTLYVFWAGQNVAWIALTLLLWLPSASPFTSVLAYSLSWVFAAVAAFYFWRAESRLWPLEAPEPGWLHRLVRYAGPRAPASLLAQLLFWADLFVLTRYASTTQVGVYAAALRAGQILMLFLTSVNLMFAPFVADLHNRDQIARLDRLYKMLTRWIVAATLPLFLVVAIAPGAVMRVFGSDFAGENAQVALLTLLLGQFVNIATGSAGFILIMVGRTGTDLLVYTGSLLLDVSVAVALAPSLGMRGAAIANAVTFACSNTARVLLVHKLVRIQPYDRRYARLALPAAVGGGVMALIHNIVSAGYLVDLLVTGAAGTLAYALAYLAIALTPDERRGLSSLAIRVRERLGGA
jgi:O-antigen/teichoic acid export membrane protein